MCTADELQQFRVLLRGLSVAASGDRVSLHLARLDLSDLWIFAFHNPDALVVRDLVAA